MSYFNFLKARETECRNCAHLGTISYFCNGRKMANDTYYCHAKKIPVVMMTGGLSVACEDKLPVTESVQKKSLTLCLATDSISRKISKIRDLIEKVEISIDYTDDDSPLLQEIKDILFDINYETQQLSEDFDELVDYLKMPF